MKKADEILGRILDEKSRKLGERYSSVFGAWSQIVGGSLAEHSRIYEIANGNVFIEVDHPGWMQLLLMKKNQILRSVQRKYPSLNVRDLKIKVNLNYTTVMPNDASHNTESHAGGQVSPRNSDGSARGEQGQQIDQMLSSVTQDDLRRRLKRLFLESIEREKSQKSPK
jgi:hypothetical protein